MPMMHCRREAHELFRSQMPRLETSTGLLYAATAIAMHQCTDVAPTLVERELQQFADQVRSRVRSDNPEALLAHLHSVLFDEGGFVGNADDYYDPRNSYLPCVIDRRRGLPITLTLIYKIVAERVGLRVNGINAPLHFMAGVELGNDDLLLIDPFFAGRALSREEAFRRIEQVSGRDIPRVEQMLPPATHRQWIARILQNLIHIFNDGQNRTDYHAMLELRSILTEEA